MSFAELYKEVISKDLCARCGACMGVCPEEAISADDDYFPELTGNCTDCGLCRRVCPGSDFDFPRFYSETYQTDFSINDCMGYLQNSYICQTKDPEIRHNCASGGTGTSLALALLRSGEVNGVGVIVMDEKRPWRAKAVIAKDEETIRRASQSKYAFVPSLEVLREMRKEGGEYAIVLLPCQGMALKKIQEASPKLARHIKYTIGLCCHYNMTHQAVTELMERYKIKPEWVTKLEYRGGGWPGGIQFTHDDGRVTKAHRTTIKTAMSYLLSIYTHERCLLCLDGFSVFTDLSLGDFWCYDYSREFRNFSRSTLVIQRTGKGKKALEIAAKQNLLKIVELPKSEKSRRLTRVFEHKRDFALTSLRNKRRRKLPHPDYHFNSVYEITSKHLRAYYLSPYYLCGLLRKRKPFRMLFLRFFFSKVGIFFTRMNSIRRRAYFKYD